MMHILVVVFSIFTTRTCFTTSSQNSDNGTDHSVSNHDLASHTTVLTSALRINWEGLLQAAPLSVFLLGQMVAISAVKDFPLDENVLLNYTLIKQSRFRSLLLQVVNAGFEAFKSAHNNMDYIGWQMIRIPSNVLGCLTILATATDRSNIAKRLQIPSEAILEAATESASAARFAYNNMVKVQALLGEVAEVFVANQGKSERDLSKLRNDIVAARIERVNRQHQTDLLQTQLEKYETDLEKGQKAYEDALSDIPTGFKKFCLGIIRRISFTEILQYGPLSFLFDVIGALKELDESDNGNIKRCLHIKQKNATKAMFMHNTSSVKMTTVSVNDIYLMHMAHGIRNGMAGMLELVKQRNESQIAAHAYVAISAFKHLQKQADSKKESLWYDHVSRLLVCGIVSLSNVTVSKQVTNSVVETFENVIRKASIIANALLPVLPVVNVLSIPDKQSAHSEISNERWKANQLKKHVGVLKQSFNKALNKLSDENIKMEELIVRMGNLDLNVPKFKSVLSILGEAIGSITRIRDKWEKLTEFVQAISNLVRVTLKQHVNSFLSYSKSASDSGNDLFVMEVLGEELEMNAVDASDMAVYLNSITTAYVEVSRKFLLPRLASVSLLLVQTDPQQQMFQLAQLQNESVVAQHEVAEILKIHSATLKAKLTNEESQIDRILYMSGSPIDEEYDDTSSKHVDLGMD